MRRKEFLGLTGLVALGPDGIRSLMQRGSDRPVADGRLTTGLQPDPRFGEIGALIETKMAQYGVPGVGFGLSKNGRAQTRGFGLTNIDNPQPVTPDTMFAVASITKTIVATGVMRLVDEGRVELDAPVREYIPDFRVQDEAVSREVTVLHLLTHTPGWEGQLGTADRGTETHAYFTAGLRDVPQLARPGEVWSYNNAGFRVAGRILEVMTDSVIHDALRELVFDPLELPLATSRTGEAMSYRFAAPHRDRDGRTEVVRPFELPVGTGSGGAAMSISNLLRYAEFHMGDGTLPNGRRVLSRASVQAMRTAQLTKNSCSDEMAAGWHLRRLQGVQTAAHGGTLAGHTLHVQLVPERGLAFGILTNHREGWRLIHDVERAILQSYEGLSLAPGQATGGNRGVNETMITHGTPLADQPSPDEYIGSYRRPPVGGVEVTAQSGRLTLGGSSGQEIVFWGPDLAYTTSGYEGYPIEFVRNDSGAVGWIRMNGRIARKA